MFGVSRHRPGLQVARRSKRRIVAVIAGVVVAAIVIGEVAADVVDAGGPASVMGDRTYATAVIPLIDESTSLVAWLKDAREQAPRLGRLGVDTALGRLVAGSSQVQEQLAQLGVRSPNARAARWLSSTFASRSDAARALVGGIAVATSAHPDG